MDPARRSCLPTVTTDRFLREGDIIWVDAGINWQGYASDYGRTWITGVDPVPNAKQQEQFRRWRSVVDAALDVLKPGVSALQLGKAAIEANDGVRPWIDHFYLAHGIGTDSAEMPLIGTDLGERFDERLIMQPGMVARLRTGHLGGRRFRLSIGRHCGRDRYGLGQTERLNLRTVRSRAHEPVPRDRGVLVGTMGLEDDARVDFARLRADRRAKVLLRHGKPRSRCADARWCRQRAIRVGCAATRAGRCASVRTCRRGGEGNRASPSALDVGRGGAAGDRLRATCTG